MIAFITGRKLQLEKIQMMAITFGALILDIDFPYYLFPGTILPAHGTITHTLGGALVLGTICALAMYAWKRKWAAQWIALGIVSHISLDMINTLSIFDDGKQLLYPLSDKVFSLKDYIPYPDLIWALISAAVFSFFIVQLAIYLIERDYPWRVWYDERSVVEYWREKLGKN